jgi:hypothetical protein
MTMKLTATMMLSVDGVHQAPEAATASPAHVSSIAAASKLRVTGTRTGNMAFYLGTLFRLLSSWGRGVMSREPLGQDRRLSQACGTQIPMRTSSRSHPS